MKINTVFDSNISIFYDIFLFRNIFTRRRPLSWQVVKINSLFDDDSSISNVLQKNKTKTNFINEKKEKKKEMLKWHVLNR